MKPVITEKEKINNAKIIMDLLLRGIIKIKKINGIDTIILLKEGENASKNF